MKTIMFAILFFISFAASAGAGDKIKSDADIQGKTGKIVTITGVGHNTKDGIYLNSYVIDDFQLPDYAEGKAIKLQGLLKKVTVVKPATPTLNGEIVQTRDGSWTHLTIEDIKWWLIDNKP